MAICPRCKEEMQKRGYKMRRGKKIQRWYCLNCRLVTTEELSNKDLNLIRDQIASVMSQKFKVKEE